MKLCPRGRMPKIALSSCGGSEIHFPAISGNIYSPHVFVGHHILHETSIMGYAICSIADRKLTSANFVYANLYFDFPMNVFTFLYHSFALEVTRLNKLNFLENGKIF